MTAFDRFDPFEQRISAALDEIAPAHRPDYLDDLLRQTARTPQRTRRSFHAVERLPQARRPLARVPWRPTPMLRIALILAAAVLVGAAVLGGALLGGARPAPSPLAVPASPAAGLPSAASAASAQPESSPGRAPDAVRGSWLATAPAGSPGDGLLRLTVNVGGNSTWISTTGGNESLRSDTQAPASGELALSLVRDGDGCTRGMLGHYRWSAGPDGSTLVLEATDDPCASRATALARTWTRSHDGVSSGGPGLVPDVGPLIAVTLPPGLYTTRPIDGAQEVFDRERDYIFYAWLNPEAFVDPCSTLKVQPWEPGAAAFVAGLRKNPALEGFETQALTVGGYPALRVTFGAKADYPRCTPDHAFYEWRPKGTNGSWWLSAGDRDELYLVDHPDGTLMYQVLPVGDATTADVIASIRFAPLGTPAP